MVASFGASRTGDERKNTPYGPTRAFRGGNARCFDIFAIARVAAPCVAFLLGKSLFSAALKNALEAGSEAPPR
jgi:hypothetical protein